MMTFLINDQWDYDESSHSHWCVQIGQLWHFIPRKTWRCSHRCPGERHMPRQTNSYPSKIVGNCLHGMSIITGCNCNVGNVFWRRRSICRRRRRLPARLWLPTEFPPLTPPERSSAPRNSTGAKSELLPARKPLLLHSEWKNRSHFLTPKIVFRYQLSILDL